VQTFMAEQKRFEDLSSKHARSEVRSAPCACGVLLPSAPQEKAHLSAQRVMALQDQLEGTHRGRASALSAAN
jgi:hypothetical protein